MFLIPLLIAALLLLLGGGIGLAVVRKAAEEMGGSEEASRSALGGLCIEVTLKKGESNDEQNTDN